MNTGIIILAAGGSTRMGSAKQCLPCDEQDTPMLRVVARAACEAGLGPVTVVLGAEAERCGAVVAGLPVSIAVNAAWRDGQGGSIAAGVAAFPEDSVSALLIVLGDQPGVTAAGLGELHAYHRALGFLITASRYAGTLGPPAVFGQSLFRRLRALEGAGGAKPLLTGDIPVAAFDMPEAEFDLDTPGDVERWRASARPPPAQPTR